MQSLQPPRNLDEHIPNLILLEILLLLLIFNDLLVQIAAIRKLHDNTVSSIWVPKIFALQECLFVRYDVGAAD